MEILVNSEPLEMEDEVTLQQLLERLGYREQTIAVALNENFVPRSEYENTMIREKDELEFVAPMAGG